MFHIIKTLGAPLAVLGAVAVPAAAIAEPAAAAAAAQVAPAADAMVVVRDPETGVLRAPTADEAKALQAQAPKSLLAKSSLGAKPAQRFHASGARGIRVTDEFTSYSVVVKQADGTMAERCVDGSDAVAKALAAPAAGASTLAKE